MAKHRRPSPTPRPADPPAPTDRRVRRPMVWRGISMFLAALPLAVIGAFVGGPMALLNLPSSTEYAVGTALLTLVGVTMWIWAAMAIFCLVRRWLRTPAEREVVHARKQAAALARSNRPPTPASSRQWFVGIDFDF